MFSETLYLSQEELFPSEDYSETDYLLFQEIVTEEPLFSYDDDSYEGYHKNIPYEEFNFISKLYNYLSHEELVSSEPEETAANTSYLLFEKGEDIIHEEYQKDLPYEEIDFIGTLYDYVVNYLSQQELYTREFDPVSVVEDSNSYLYLQEFVVV